MQQVEKGLLSAEDRGRFEEAEALAGARFAMGQEVLRGRAAALEPHDPVAFADFCSQWGRFAKQRLCAQQRRDHLQTDLQRARACKREGSPVRAETE
jgi:hypothetical protein